MKKNIINEIVDAVNSMKTFINNDGGDLEFIKYEEKIVTLKVSGACVDCGMFDITFDKGIKESLLLEFPKDIKDVIFIY